MVFKPETPDTADHKKSHPDAADIGKHLLQDAQHLPKNAEQIIGNAFQHQQPSEKQLSGALTFESPYPKTGAQDKSEKSTERGEQIKAGPDGSKLHVDGQGRITEIDYRNGASDRIFYDGDSKNVLSIQRKDSYGSTVDFYKTDADNPQNQQWEKIITGKDGTVLSQDKLKDCAISVQADGKVNISYTDKDGNRQVENHTTDGNVG